MWFSNTHQEIIKMPVLTERHPFSRCTVTISVSKLTEEMRSSLGLLPVP